MLFISFAALAVGFEQLYEERAATSSEAEYELRILCMLSALKCVESAARGLSLAGLPPPNSFATAIGFAAAIVVPLASGAPFQLAQRHGASIGLFRLNPLALFAASVACIYWAVVSVAGARAKSPASPRRFVATLGLGSGERPAHQRPLRFAHLVMILASICLGVFLLRRNEWGIMLLASLISLVATFTVPVLEDFGTVVLLGVYVLADWELRPAAEYTPA